MTKVTKKSKYFKLYNGVGAVQKATDDVESGMSKSKASQKYKLPRQTTLI